MIARVLLKLIEKEDWIEDAEKRKKWTLPPDLSGLSHKSPDTIARVLSEYHGSCKSALDSATFFYNRFGCTGKRSGYDICKKYDEVIEILRELECEE